MFSIIDMLPLATQIKYELLSVSSHLYDWSVVSDSSFWLVENETTRRIMTMALILQEFYANSFLIKFEMQSHDELNCNVLDFKLLIKSKQNS